MVVEIKRQICDGHALKWLFSAGLAWLQHNQDRVDQLNVFPVPDGDTGKNMRFTMQKAYEAVAELDEAHVGIVSDRIAKGALRGARGNSGVILSQLWRGFADALQGHEVFDADLLAVACRSAVNSAYKAVIDPTEGTILTVSRETAQLVEEMAKTQKDLVELLEALIDQARESLARTPELLPVLKKAGVVDSGGQGLVYILEGMLRAVEGEPVYIEDESPVPQSNSNNDLHDALDPTDEEGYGYDVQFLMHGENMDVEAVRANIDAMGWSTLVVGDESLIKVHVHVHDPGEPLSYAIAHGARIDDIVVENMQMQYEQYIEARMASQIDQNRQVDGVAVITVASGIGMIRLLYGDLHATRVISGGQTMNPSAEDFLDAINSVDSTEIVLLPNNSNIVMAAQQAARMTEDKTVRVVPTRTIPQGISALLSTLDLRETSGIDEVLDIMNDAIAHVITAEVTTAIRDSHVGEIVINEGDNIGLVNGTLVVAEAALNDAVRELLHKAGADERELITLYYGEGLTQADTVTLLNMLTKAFPNQDVQIVEGGQPLYPYIISIE